jgi:glyoxylase-like metal-dependent hydrolase (beta-lactamase superfamily II)/8-oxo-dGTP pyrophosphatase MutT (NUDIX family)
MPAEPKKSAAAIIVDANTDRDILLVQRSDAMRNMAGHFVFPGGMIDEGEGAVHVLNAPSEADAVAIHAVVREVFEESGLLCVEGRLPPDEQLHAARLALLAGDETLDQILERFTLTIDGRRFEPAGVWVTPEQLPVRFHTRYYLYHHHGPRYERLIPGEIQRVEWFNPANARQQWRTGKIQIPPPVAYVLHHLARVPYPDVLVPLRRTSHMDVSTPGRIEFRGGIYVIPFLVTAFGYPLHTNCIAVGEDELYIIDPGAPEGEQTDNLITQIDELLEIGSKVSAIVLTHGHSDHVGAVEAVRDRYNAPVWAHEITAGVVKFPVDRHLVHNEKIVISGRPDWVLRCLFTPGHDPGHLCFLEESTETLLCGDMVAQSTGIVISLDWGGNMTHYLDSLESLLEPEYHLMIPSHGMPIHHPHKKVRQYINHRLEREDKIKAALKDGITEIPQLLETVYNDVPEKTWPLAEHSLKAHLARLGQTPQP